MPREGGELKDSSPKAPQSPSAASDDRPQSLSWLRRWGVSLACALAAALTMAAGIAAGGRSYVPVSFLLLAYALMPVLASFEARRPAARELVLIAVMGALAVASRAAFLWLPHFKPMVAIIMVAGIAFGARTGFLVGALSALASNFIFGQGPWTPWQMVAFGVAGLIMGALADRGAIPRHDLSWRARLGVAVGGFVLVVAVTGPILDTSSVVLMLSRVTPEGALAVYLAGLPVNLMHAGATALTLLLAANPLLGQLHRVRVKYGLAPPKR